MLHDVQYVIYCLSRNTAPPWLKSADPTVSFTFAGGEKAHSETRIWLPLPAILLGLDMLREFGLLMNVDLAYCYSTKLRCSIPVTVLPSGHLALALTPSGNFETTGEMTTLVDEADADMAAAVQRTLLSRDSAPSLREPRATMETQNRYQDCLEIFFANLQQLPSRWTRQWLRLSMPPVLFSDLIWLWWLLGRYRRSYYGRRYRGRMVEWRFDHCARCGETQRMDHDEEPTTSSVLLSGRKQHAVRKLSSNIGSISSSSSVQRTSHPVSHVQSCSRHGILWSM